MANEQIFTNSLIVTAALQQAQNLETLRKLLMEVIDRVDAIGDSQWQMSRKINQYSPLEGNHKRKKRRLTAASRKRARRG